MGTTMKNSEGVFCSFLAWALYGMGGQKAPHIGGGSDARWGVVLEFLVFFISVFCGVLFVWCCIFFFSCSLFFFF